MIKHAFVVIKAEMIRMSKNDIIRKVFLVFRGKINDVVRESFDFCCQRTVDEFSGIYSCVHW